MECLFLPKWVTVAPDIALITVVKFRGITTIYSRVNINK